MNDNHFIRLEKMAQLIRRTCLDLAYQKTPKPTHFGGGLSAVDILVCLYFSEMRLNKANPIWQDRDRFFLSKGHGILGYYSTLYHAGFLSKDELSTYGEDGTFLPGHPVRNKIKGIEFTNGSLGLGLSVGIGHSLAARKLGLKFRTFVLMGDGECDEGSVWEAVMSASHFKLDNLTVIIDRNSLQQTGSCETILDLGDIAEKFSAFGWHSINIDGHDLKEIMGALAVDVIGKPKVIVAKTLKGKGFSFSEGKVEWHHNIITKQMYEIGVEECSKM